MVGRIEDVAEFENLYKGSAFTIEGAGGDLNEWDEGINSMLANEEIGHVNTFYTYTGAQMNAYYGLTGSNAYLSDLTFLSFLLNGLDIGKLAMFKLQFGARWFDDIVDNNARRERR